MAPLWTFRVTYGGFEARRKRSGSAEVERPNGGSLQDGVFTGGSGRRGRAKSLGSERAPPRVTNPRRCQVRHRATGPQAGLNRPSGSAWPLESGGPGARGAGSGGHALGRTSDRPTFVGLPCPWGRAQTLAMSVPDIGVLSTGEFGRRAGLSVKALRLYDVSGLLPPAATDPVSGYRRYTADQLERARRISLLRRMDMPLRVIAEVLAGSDEEAGLRLDRWWVAQEATMHARRGSYGWLRAQLRHAGGPERRYEVRVRDVPTTKIAAIRSEVDQERLSDAIGELEWEVRAHLVAQGAAVTSEFWVIYHGTVTPDSVAPIEVGVPYAGTVEPVGEIAIRLAAAHREAYAIVERDDCFYPRIVRAYEAVMAYAPAVGPPREVYLDRWERLGGSDPFVYVAQPIEG